MDDVELLFARLSKPEAEATATVAAAAVAVTTAAEAPTETPIPTDCAAPATVATIPGGTKSE